MDDLKYEIYNTKQFRVFESKCKRCGECCGSQDGDPCVNLAKDEISGRFYCRVYENRFGLQKTISGKAFHCISMRDIAKHGFLKPNCAYNKHKELI